MNAPSTAAPRVPVDPATVRRVLVRANNWIGDVVMISPAVRALRRRFPKAAIAIVAKRWVLETVAGNPCFDDLIEYDHDGTHRGVSGRLLLARQIRAGGPVDLAVLFQKAFDAALLAWLARVRVRVGYATDARRLLLTHPLPPPARDRHHLDAFLDLVRAVGCVEIDPVPVFHVGESEQSFAGDLLRRRGFDGVSPLVALHPGASKTPRAWHAERFAELARRLRQRRGARFVILGGPGEEDVVRQVGAGLDAADWIGPREAPGLLQAAALLARCRLFVGNDSGPMHLAAALDVPTLGLFGPGLPRNTGPRGRPGRVETISRDYPCAPCRQDFFRECPPAPSGKPFCLEEIGVDEVEQAALRLLA
jgi:lipopolysaccharide heptosyltransferase II